MSFISSQTSQSQSSQYRGGISSGFLLRQPALIGRRGSSSSTSAAGAGAVPSTPPVDQCRVLLQVEKLGIELEQAKQAIEALARLPDQIRALNETLQQLAGARASDQAPDAMVEKVKSTMRDSLVSVQDELRLTLCESEMRQRDYLDARLESQKQTFVERVDSDPQKLDRLEGGIEGVDAVAPSLDQVRAEVIEMRKEFRDHLTILARTQQVILDVPELSSPPRLRRPAAGLSPSLARAAKAGSDLGSSSSAASANSLTSENVSRGLIRNNEARKHHRIRPNGRRTTGRKLIDSDMETG